jgi:endonuclease YncB( thermonuclease family)
VGLGASRLAIAARPLVEAMAQPAIGGSLAFAGGIALGSGIGRYRSAGLDTEATATLLVGALLLLAALPMLLRLTGLRLPSVTISPQIATVGILVAAVAAGAAWFLKGGTGGLAGLGASLPLVGSGKRIESRGQALGGDLLRVGTSTVRLAGIEAPERGQTCGSASRRWRCGAAAEAALNRLVSGRIVRCTLSGTDDGGRPLASCSSGTTDLSAELVRRGYVFAASGLFGSYASLEHEARSSKAGIWAGDAERPSAYRAKVWDEAKRRAPEGCPIKGLVTGAGRVYLLPWSADYDRGRVQKGRGERWFCSEREALAAGWKASARG